MRGPPSRERTRAGGGSPAGSATPAGADVSAARRAAEPAAEPAGDAGSAEGVGAVRHLYVHIPFCRRRCRYCDFASEPLASHERRGSLEAYFGRLRTELEVRREFLADRLSTLYIGGGTPTAVPPHLLLGFLDHVGVLVGAGAEVTVEANPESLEPVLLAALIERGVNRVSLGVQSFSPALRASLGRRVPDGAVEAALETVAAGALASWNLDLVFGMPGQDQASAKRDLRSAVATGAPHISLYDLTYTPAYLSFVEARLGPGAHAAAAEFAEEQYAGAVDVLQAAGYRRYEVSNFALPGHECRHNQAYWQGRDYLGIGAAAVSTVALERRANPASVQAYLDGRPAALERLDPRTRLLERAMLGLRTAEGVPRSEVEDVLLGEEVDGLADQGFIECSCGRLRLTRRGLDLSNAVLASILDWAIPGHSTS